MRPPSGSWLARRLSPPHPDAFAVGVRENGRWQFRSSAVDPYQPGGVVSMRHGDRSLRFRPDSVREA